MIRKLAAVNPIAYIVAGVATTGATLTGLYWREIARADVALFHLVAGALAHLAG